jgi:hypothetical protein
MLAYNTTTAEINYTPLMNTFTPTYSTPTLTLPLTTTPTQFSSGYYAFSGTTNSVTTITISGTPVNNGQYTVYLYNGGSGATTITNGSSSATQRFTFTSITVNTLRYCILTLIYSSTSSAYLISGAAYNN